MGETTQRYRVSGKCLRFLPEYIQQCPISAAVKWCLTVLVSVSFRFELSLSNYLAGVTSLKLKKV